MPHPLLLHAKACYYSRIILNSLPLLLFSKLFCHNYLRPNLCTLPVTNGGYLIEFVVNFKCSVCMSQRFCLVFGSLIYHFRLLLVACKVQMLLYYVLLLHRPHFPMIFPMTPAFTGTQQLHAPVSNYEYYCTEFTQPYVHVLVYRPH